MALPSFRRSGSVVIDIGSGYTKMGFAGNVEPQFVVPTCVANSTKKAGGVHISQAQSSGAAEADFYIGDEAYQRKDSPSYLLSYPVSKGRIEQWDDMERFLQQAIYRNLRCTPEDHCFLMTEPPFNTAENRELMAEVMFETFNVKGLHIAVQAVLALYGKAHMESMEAENPQPVNVGDLTGLVVDSGDGLTHVIPVADGYVIGSCIQEIPLGGRHVTQFIADMLTDRGEPVPPENRMEAARHIKEQHAYFCKDVVEEYEKFDREPAKRFKNHSGVFHKTNTKWTVEVGYERFLAPELFFHPELFVDSVTTPLPEVVDHCIQQCPIDYRRRLYSNVVLSGGSTTFQNFKERLQLEVQNLVFNRLAKARTVSGAAPQDINVQVSAAERRGKKQPRYAAWLGGSLFAQAESFEAFCKSKREYDEVGPQCMRGNPVLLG